MIKLKFRKRFLRCFENLFLIEVERICDPLCKYFRILKGEVGQGKGYSFQILVSSDYLSIIGYDDIPSSALAELTTVRQPFMEMGKSAIMQLYAAIADAHTPKKTTVLPSSIVIRSSCAVLKE